MSQSGMVCCSKPYCIHRKDENIHNTALIVEDKKLYVGKQVLATYSPVFHAMFFSGFKESTADEILIQDVKYDDMEQFLTAIYGWVKIDDSNIVGILELADRFDVQDVMKKCEQPLIEAIHVTDKQKLIYAERFGFSNVQTTILNRLTLDTIRSIAADPSEFGEETLRRLFQKSLPFLNAPPPPAPVYRDHGNWRQSPHVHVRRFQ